MDVYLLHRQGDPLGAWCVDLHHCYGVQLAAGTWTAGAMPGPAASADDRPGDAHYMCVPQRRGLLPAKRVGDHAVSSCCQQAHDSWVLIAFAAMDQALSGTRNPRFTPTERVALNKDCLRDPGLVWWQPSNKHVLGSVMATANLRTTPPSNACQY